MLIKFYNFQYRNQMISLCILLDITPIFSMWDLLHILKFLWKMDNCNLSKNMQEMPYSHFLQRLHPSTPPSLPKILWRSSAYY